MVAQTCTVKFQPKKLEEHIISDSDYTDYCFTTPCTLSGGFIVFGGRLKIFPADLLGDSVKREAYCAMGGLGVSAYHDTGVFMCSDGGCPKGKWWTPHYVYNHTASVMAYAASEANPEGEIIFLISIPISLPLSNLIPQDRRLLAAVLLIGRRPDRSLTGLYSRAML